MRQFFRYFIKGVAWRNPIVKAALVVIDPLDKIACAINGHKGLPKFSIRIRSNGFNNQFGGNRFAKNGKEILSLLEENAQIKPSSDILEIGCGCGRTAIALADYLTTGSFTGMDIEEVSLASCSKNNKLKKNNFQFDFLNVQNDEFNPDGEFDASEYKFPYPDNSFDTIYLISVFTHMLTDDIKNYNKEMARMLKPGGTIFISTFLVEAGKTEFEGFSFKFKAQDHYFIDESMPEIAVAYEKRFFDDQFSKLGLVEKRNPLYGGWRTPTELETVGDFSQDLVFYSTASDA